MTAISAINNHYGLKLFTTLLCAYNWPEFIVMSCLIARELRKNEKVWILQGAGWGGGHLLENMRNEYPVCSVLFSLLLLP